MSRIPSRRTHFFKVITFVGSFCLTEFDGSAASIFLKEDASFFSFWIFVSFHFLFWLLVKCLKYEAVSKNFPSFVACAIEDVKFVNNIISQTFTGVVQNGSYLVYLVYLKHLFCLSFSFQGNLPTLFGCLFWWAHRGIWRPLAPFTLDITIPPVRPLDVPSLQSTLRAPP